ncbi:GrpB family protein [Sporosarcina gallistercoris]|uniref:GrpB family protein n=1 Tax=Sporosarcina gallistercoris TaxID=2762245 RepID=A0ABR8PK35_9BACL|nr:GrpB family protein [Sporosarcina gallistercoris]MBD7908533.1 GrpB family protein [Sporosarcina gallistercoris]
MMSKRKVEVLPYSSLWLSAFQEEAAILRGIFGSDVLEVHHIGSTAVVGLSAKPVIDLLLVVRSIACVDAHNDAMRGIGYEPKGENGIEGRRYFQKGGNERSHHVHVFEEGCAEITRHLLFRDFLRAHPARAMEYGELKTQLAEQYPDDIEKYIEGKSEVIRQIECDAAEWL